jgi:hypothetical protein
MEIFKIGGKCSFIAQNTKFVAKQDRFAEHEIERA